MHDILYGLLAKEEPRASSVVGHKTVSNADLSVTELRYIQGGKFCAAKAYHTDCWVCKSPLGPPNFNQKFGKFDCGSLHDVARITRYASIRELDARLWPNIEELVSFQCAIDLASDKAVRSQWPSLGTYIHRVSFHYVPSPAIIVLCADKANHDALIGTIEIDVAGVARPISRCSDKIFEILGIISGNQLPPITEEIIYE